MNPKITVAFVALAIAFAGCKTDCPAFKPARAKTQITELHMLNARDGWAWSGGLPGQNSLLRTHDGGMSWRDVTPRGFSQIEEEGACFRDARTAWIPIFNRTNVTAGLLHTTDGGKSWSLLNRTNTPFFNDASSCRFYSSTYGVGNSSDNGAGSAYVTFFETHDFGKTWSQMPFTPRFPDLAESNTFHLSNIGGDRIAFYPPASVMMTYGDTADEKPKGFVRFSRTTDLGKNWRDVELPLPKQYEDFLCVPFGPVFVDKQNIVLAAHVFESTTNSYSNGALIFYTSHDGGATWIAKEGMIALKQPWYTVKVVSPKCFFVANGPDICVTHDGAQSWQTIAPNISFGGNSKRDIVRMDFVDATHGWLLISDNSQFYPDGKFILYRTRDGGKNWTELPARIVNNAT